MADNQNIQILPVQTMPSQTQGATPGFIQQAQDPNEMIEGLKLSWKAMEWVQDEKNPGRMELKKFGKPVMNDDGVSALCGIVRGLISRHIMNAAYGLKSVNDRLFMFGEELSKEMRWKYKDWGLDLHSSGRVFRQIILQVDGTYRQALDIQGDGMGSWRKTAISTYNESKIIDSSQPQAKPGALSRSPFTSARQS